MEQWPRNMPGSKGTTLNYHRVRKANGSEISQVSFEIWRTYQIDPYREKFTYLQFQGGVLDVQEGETFALLGTELRALSLNMRDGNRARFEVLRGGSSLGAQKNIGKGIYLCENSALKDGDCSFTFGAIERVDDKPDEFAVSLRYFETPGGVPKASVIKVRHIIPMAEYELMVTDIKLGDVTSRKRGWIVVEPVLPLATRLPE